MIKYWNADNYDKYIQYLKSLKDEKYLNFQVSLSCSKYEMLGIRIPLLRKIADKIAKSDYIEFLELCSDNYYEEVMIEGLVIAKIKEEKVFDEYFEKFILKVENWAICDTFCNSLKFMKGKQKYFRKALKLAKDKQEFISRIGLVIILNFFIEKENLQNIFKTLNEIKNDKYYVNMAEAWLICELFIYYPHETEKYLQSSQLNNFTHNKAISKIRESYRVSKEVKNHLQALKKK